MGRLDETTAGPELFRALHAVRRAIHAKPGLTELIAECCTELAGESLSTGAGHIASGPAKKKRPRRKAARTIAAAARVAAAPAVALPPPRLTELPPVALLRAASFLSIPELGTVDVLCQLFHPVGLTQKVCMAHAGRWLRDDEKRAKVARPTMGWPQWLDRVGFRRRQRESQWGGGWAANHGEDADGQCTLVVQDDGMSAQLGRMLKQAGQQAPATKPVLEVNAEHALVKKLDGSVHFHDLAHILFDQALLAEGGLPEDPAAYVKRVNALLV